MAAETRRARRAQNPPTVAVEVPLTAARVDLEAEAADTITVVPTYERRDIASSAPGWADDLDDDDEEEDELKANWHVGDDGQPFDELRDGFVAVFGEEVALQIEGASKTHLADLNIATDDVGSSEFAYHFVNCVARDCMTRWRTAHGIQAGESELRLWALETQVVGRFDGTPPELLALFDGTYKAWTTGEGA